MSLRALSPADVFTEWCAQQAKSTRGWVYFLSQTDGNDNVVVKIGYCRDLAKRMSEYRTYVFSALLVFAVPGDPALEKAIHRRFAHLRIRTEWFEFDGELVDIVRSAGPIDEHFLTASMELQ